MSVNVSTVMALDRSSPGLARAVASLHAQELRPLEVIVVLNPPTSSHVEALAQTISDAARGWSAVRLVGAVGRNLASALNLGLREARHELVARMDADDESVPARLAAQAALLVNQPGIVALGCWFERIDEHGNTIASEPLPCDPAELRWRLLLRNQLAHGSVMLRRSAVLAAGGYDESCERAQDYELWLRLTRHGPCVANLGQVLYRYRCDPSLRTPWGWASGAAQSRTAAAALSRAWAGLPEGGDDAALQSAMARVLAGDPLGLTEIERLLTAQGPTGARLSAYLWARDTLSPAAGLSPALEAGRRALLREAGARLRRAGAGEVWLWGSGRHTAWVLARKDDLGVPVAGLIDDHRAGAVAHGFHVRHPSELEAAAHVLLSSDAHENEMWDSSTAARARGVTVWRLYADGPLDRQPRSARKHPSGAAA